LVFRTANAVTADAARLPSLAWLLLALALTSGCAHFPAAGELQAGPLPQPRPSFAPVRDERAAFRATFCARLDASPSNTVAPQDCDALLWRLPDESPARSDDIAFPATALPSFRIVVVTGALGDCRWKDMLPFGQAIDRLIANGVRVDAVVVGGRSSAEHNARQIAEALERSQSATREPVVMVGYSKGTVDILEFLVTYPELAQDVAAVVSFGGPVFGSPLAVDAERYYRHLPADAFSEFCEPGDGGVFTSLLPHVRQQWMAAHPLPQHVRYFSVAAFTTRDHLSRGLRHSWHELATVDERNDGQVALQDALIPGSTLLALVNSDHWDLAIALEAQVPYLSSRPSERQFPRDVLFESVLAYVTGALDSDSNATRTPASNSLLPDPLPLVSRIDSN
jgi:hypothetical protein